MKEKKDIRTLDLNEISFFFEQNNIARFRAKQVYEWLWKKRALSFDEMTSLSISDRSLLNKHFAINSVSIHKMEQSNDNTIKYSLKLYDNKLVEGVLIPSRKNHEQSLLSI